MWSAGFTNPNQQSCTLSWGFSHRVGRYRPVGSTSWSLVCWICRDMEFMIRGWILILPVCSTTSTMARGTTRATCWLMNPSQSAISQWGVGVSTPHGVVSTRGISFLVPEVFELLRYGRVSHPGMKKYPPRVGEDLDVGRGATLDSRWLHAPANQ